MSALFWLAQAQMCQIEPSFFAVPRFRGFRPLEGAIGHIAWRDLDEEAETEKSMQFWIKTL